ncbi:MAG: DUF2950 domain-containing protein [Desulfatirhabdiaceae bacterium]
MKPVSDRENGSCHPGLGAAVIIAVMLSVIVMPGGFRAASGATSFQQTFDSPEVGAAAMAAAVRANDTRSLLAIFGPDGDQLFSSGDDVADQEDRQDFCNLYQARNTLEWVGDAKAILLVGNNDWPFPIPLVRKGDTWVFDSKAGREEILNRRIGRNELSAAQVCLAYVDAQYEYALGDKDRKGTFEYAQKFVSDPGKQNGLYWASREGEKPSLLGPAIAMASPKDYRKIHSAGSAVPYYGYYYNILTAQGPNASGGAYDYVVNDRMIGGFGLVAYPANFGRSGIMTFIVSMDGIVYEKNLGKNSARIADTMTRFDPDKTWKMTVYGDMP